MTQPGLSPVTDPRSGEFSPRAADTRPSGQSSSRRLPRATRFWRGLAHHVVRPARLRVGAGIGARREHAALTVAGRHAPNFHVRIDAEARVLTLSGDMDLAAVSPFTVASASLTVGRRGGVTLDLRDLRFVDASGLGALVALSNILRRGGQPLTILEPSARIARTFGLAGLSGLLSTAG